MSDRETPLSDGDVARLLGFRDGMRRFLHWSEEQAEAGGLTAAQHQVLLTIRGHGDSPSIRAGLVERQADEHDQRVVRLGLTELGEAKLAALTTTHLEELSRRRPRFATLWQGLPETEPKPTTRRRRATSCGSRRDVDGSRARQSG